MLERTSPVNILLPNPREASRERSADTRSRIPTSCPLALHWEPEARKRGLSMFESTPHRSPHHRAGKPEGPISPQKFTLKQVFEWGSERLLILSADDAIMQSTRLEVFRRIQQVGVHRCACRCFARYRCDLGGHVASYYACSAREQPGTAPGLIPYVVLWCSVSIYTVVDLYGLVFVCCTQLLMSTAKAV